jgi:hypothetical protein
MEALRPGQVITPNLFDELRYGNSDRATFINEFETASAAEAACREFEKKNGYHEVRHALLRMYNTWYNLQKRESKRLVVKQKIEQSELQYAQDVIVTERRLALNKAHTRKQRRNNERRGKYL